jgi:nicotinamidase/pyrazinamidase
VRNTPGAAFGPGLDTSRFEEVFRKGTDPGIDSYSGFFDNGRLKATGLGDFLKVRKVTDVFIAGLTTDYCVRFTALDAVALGFRTHVLLDGCRGVNLDPADVAQAIAEMETAGVELC